MAFDLSTARPIDGSSPTRPSGTRGFDLSTARPIDDSDVTSNTDEQRIETTMLGSAAASGAEAALAMPAVLTGAGAGARVGGIAGAALGSVIPVLGTTAGGITGTIVGGITGAIAAGMLAEKGIHTIEEAVDQNFGTDIVKTRLAQQQQRPYASAFGQLVGGGLGPGSTFGLAKEAINIGGRQVGRAGQAAIGAGAMTGIGATQRALTGGDPFDPVLMAADVAGGGLTRPTKLGEKFINFGGKIIPGRTAPEGTRTPTDSTEAPKPLTPNEVDIKKNEDSLIREFELGTNPNKQLDQAAFMDTKTGEYIKQGARHDELLKKNPALVAGFLLKDGTFVTRKEAAVIAKDQHADKLVEEIDPKQGLRSSNFGSERMDALKPKDLIFYKDKLKELIYEKRSLEELLDQDRSWDVEIESIKRQEKRIAKLQEQINETQKLHDSLEQGTETKSATEPGAVELNQPFVNSNRVIAITEVNGVRVPFYISTGSGGKASVPAGKWYPFFGIAEDGWFNKGSEQNINDFYGSAALKAKAEELNKQHGDIRNRRDDGTLPFAWDGKAPRNQWSTYIRADVNEGLTPASNGSGGALDNINNLLTKINKGQSEKNTNAALTESLILLKYLEIKKQYEDALASPDKYSKEQIEALNQKRLSIRDKLLTAKLATIENPVLRKMALEGSVDDPFLNSNNILNTGELVTYLKSKFGDNHYISQMLNVLNVDPNTNVSILSSDEFKLAAQKYGASPKAPAFLSVWTDPNGKITQGIFIEKGRGTNAIVAAHELGHAAFLLKIKQIQALPANHPDAVRLKKLVSNVENILADVKSKVDLKTLPIDGKRKLNYALKDVHEFISDGLFQPTVIQELMAIDRANPNLGFVDKILKAVSDFFGMNSKQYTAFHDLIASVSKLSEVDMPKNHHTVIVAPRPSSRGASETSSSESIQMGSMKDVLEGKAKQDSIYGFDKKGAEEYKRLGDFHSSLISEMGRYRSGISVTEKRNILERLSKQADDVLRRQKNLINEYKENSLGTLIGKAKQAAEYLKTPRLIAGTAVESGDTGIVKEASPSSASEPAAAAPTAVDPRRYDPRRVTDEADLKLKGKELYASKGEAAAREFIQGYEKYKLDWVDPVKFVEDAVGINLNNQMAIRRNVTNNAERLKEMVPDPVAREQIAIIIDDGRIGVLGGPARALADKYTSDMKDIGERALKEGVVKGLLTDYVTHIVNWADMPKGALDTFLGDVFKTAGDSTKKMTTESRFGMERKIETFTQLERVLADINKRIALAGKDFRLEIKTKDIAEIYKQYGLSMEKAIENKKLVESVLSARNPAGESLIRRVTDEAPLPRGWEMINDRQFAGYAVHPDLAPALKFAFENKTGTILNALYTVSQAVKRLNVFASFFHAKSLLEVQSSTGIPLVTPLKEVGLGIVDKVRGTEVSGIRKAVEQFKRGGLGDSVDKWIRAGLVLEIPEDVKKGILGSIGKFSDSMIGKYGPKTHILESALTTTEKYTLGITDKITWDYLHTGGKLYVADKYLERARIDAGKKGIPFDEAAARKEIISFVNKAFGGLNWFQEARSVQNEFGKRMSMAAYSPEGRKYLQLLLFAPDWTISTIKAFTAALPKDFNPTKWHPIEGIRGMATPSTQADYARLYQFKTALTYLTLINGINLLTAGHPIWENKDPTRIEFEDGTSMQAMKHAMEPYHWLADPAKTLTNKLGFLPKAAIVATTGLEYPSPYAPKMVDPSAFNRAKAIASMALPFQVSAAISAPEGEGFKRALYGTGGIPLYGSTVDQKKAINKERSKQINEKRKEYRSSEREAGR